MTTPTTQSLSGWVKDGVSRVRKPHWVNPHDYVRMDLIDGARGPWLHLYSPTQPLIGEPTPQTFLALDDDAGWGRYDGPKNEKDVSP